MGVLQAGKLADVIVLKQNPVADIRVLQDSSNIALVIKDGKKVDLDADASEEAKLNFQVAVA